MIALKSSETMQLIIWALESHSIRFYGPGATSTPSDIACNLFYHQRSRGWWFHWSDCSSYDKSCWITASASKFASFEVISVSNKWCTTASVSGNDRFRDGAFTPAFFRPKKSQSHVPFPLLKHWTRLRKWFSTVHKVYAVFESLAKLVNVQHSLGFFQEICLFLFGKVAT